MLRRLQRLWGYGVASLLIFFFVFFIKGYEVTKVTGVTGVTLAIKGSFPHQIQGYRVASLLNFSLNILLIKGYEVTKVTRVTGVTMALHQGVLSYIKFKVTRLQGYQRVEFFLQFFRIKWLRGYLGYRGYMGYDDPPSRGPVLIKFKVTRLQGYQWVEFFSSNF